MEQVKFKEWLCDIKYEHYSGNNRVAIILMDSTNGDIVTIATTNLANLYLPDGYVFIDNCSQNKGIVGALVKAGAIEETGKYADNGFATFPVCKLLKRPKDTLVNPNVPVYLRDHSIVRRSDSVEVYRSSLDNCVSNIIYFTGDDLYTIQPRDIQDESS